MFLDILILISAFIGLVILTPLLVLSFFETLQLLDFGQSLNDSPHSIFHHANGMALKDIAPYKLPPLRMERSQQMAMGFKLLDNSNWLTIDSNYLHEHLIRRNSLRDCYSNVIQCLPGSEQACQETLDLVVNFLTARYKHYFTVKESQIRNHLTNETHLVGTQCPHPLEIAARLAMEDFNIMMKNSESGEYRLQASATLFPAGWQLQERIGTSIANVHSPVPGWKERLNENVTRYFNHLTPKNRMERTNLFIQTTKDLFQDSSSFQQSPVLEPKDVSIRRERQTFTRLEKSGAVLFTVRTYLQPLLELERSEIEELVSQVTGWEDEMAKYKGFPVWGELLLGWCKEKLESKF